MFAFFRCHRRNEAGGFENVQHSDEGEQSHDDCHQNCGNAAFSNTWFIVLKYFRSFEQRSKMSTTYSSTSRAKSRAWRRRLGAFSWSTFCRGAFPRSAFPWSGPLRTLLGWYCNETSYAGKMIVEKRKFSYLPLSSRCACHPSTLYFVESWNQTRSFGQWIELHKRNVVTITNGGGANKSCCCCGLSGDAK